MSEDSDFVHALPLPGEAADAREFARVAAKGDLTRSGVSVD